jgi:seryl-tRNA synthetase
MSQNAESFNPFDPAGVFKSLRDANTDAWAKAMIQLVNTEAYARATAVMLDAWLASSGPFRQAIEKSMAQALASLNMPTREDVTRLAERLTNIELRLDNLEVKLDEARAASRPPSGHAKTKRGPAENES